MDWDDLRYFVKVAETGSLLSAAKFLRVNVATVGRHVERLEAALGRKLFHRTQQGYRLTAEGERLAHWARRVQGEFALLPDMFADASDADAVAGTVSLSTTEPLATHFVAPLLPALQARHPRIALEISGEVRPVNLSRRESDIALRVGDLPSGNLKVRRAGTVGYGLYAAPEYLAAHGRPDPGDGFAGHRLVTWPTSDGPNVYADWLAALAPNARPALLTASGGTRMMAARRGLGVTLLPCFMVDADSGLVRLDPPPEPLLVPLSLISHAELSASPAIRAVLDFLAAAARQQADRLRGAAAPGRRDQSAGRGNSSR